MRLIVNGEEKQYEGAPTLADFLRQYAGGKRVAVLLNNEVIPAARFQEVTLRAGDRLEILALAGGG